jgi:hypothetical protein
VSVASPFLGTSSQPPTRWCSQSCSFHSQRCSSHAPLSSLVRRSIPNNGLERMAQAMNAFANVCPGGAGKHGRTGRGTRAFSVVSPLCSCLLLSSKKTDCNSSSRQWFDDWTDLNRLFAAADREQSVKEKSRIRVPKPRKGTNVSMQRVTSTMPFSRSAMNVKKLRFLTFRE